MKIIHEWSSALRSGLYRDARLYTGKDRHSYLKQTVWSVQDGSYVPVYSALGVLAVLRDCAFVPGPHGVFVCRSHSDYKDNIYVDFPDLSDSERRIVQDINVRYAGGFSFDDLASRLDEHVPLGYRFATVNAHA